MQLHNPTCKWHSMVLELASAMFLKSYELRILSEFRYILISDNSASFKCNNQSQNTVFESKKALTSSFFFFKNFPAVFIFDKHRTITLVLMNFKH